MRRWLDGFWMSWGMFLAIPCPCRRWNEDARTEMLACLPLVGAVAGGFWVLVSWLTGLFPCPVPLRALLLATAPWALSGFLHLDGFMDVCDAVLSRRDLATRQKVLKDPHCGSFAVICMILLALGQWSLFWSAEPLPLLSLAMVPVATRACAGLAVLSLRPMGGSQYAGVDQAGCRGKKGLLFALFFVAVCLAVLLHGWAGCAPLLAGAVYALAVFYGCRQLDGMSGDISGFALTLGELAGVAVVTLVR